MRDPARIDTVLAAVREAWLAAPDQRLGQLICNASRRPHSLPTIQQVWNVEDTTLAEALRRTVGPS